MDVKSQALQATNDPISWKSHEEQTRQHEQDLELFSSTGLELLEMNPEEDLFAFIFRMDESTIALAGIDITERQQ